MTNDWRTGAACRSTDPEVFFVTGSTGLVYEAQVQRAKSICYSCPSLQPCRTWALAALSHGIAGGLTEAERRHIRQHDGQPPVMDPSPATPQEQAAAGRAAIQAGMSPQRAAAEFGVTERTAARWAAQVRMQAEVAS